uniref:Uncharacterized protein n=1 Tax=Romanomermis culicivorax TaxID=13658 RepID=A0A915K2Q3_ROMCU
MHEPYDDELLETPIFDLNIAKLLADVITLSHDQSTTLAAALKAYGFPELPPMMLLLEHHWQDYLLALCDQILAILMPALDATPAAMQTMPLVDMALVVPQSVPQSIAAQPLLTVLMDAQLQEHCTSTAQLDQHGQPIQKPAH